MRWLLFLIVSSGAGTAAMTLLERLGVNIWVSRGIGGIVAGVAGVLIYNLLINKK